MNFSSNAEFFAQKWAIFLSAFQLLCINLNFNENAEKSAFPHFCVNANSDLNAENSAILHFCMHLKFDQNAEVHPPLWRTPWQCEKVEVKRFQLSGGETKYSAFI